jgi:hypothetical protein
MPQRAATGAWWSRVVGPEEVVAMRAMVVDDSKAMRMMLTRMPRECGFDEYLMKPFTEDALLEKLELARTRY